MLPPWGNRGSTGAGGCGVGWTRCPVSRSGHGWGRMGQLKVHAGSQRSTGMGPGSGPCALDGLEDLYINDGLCDACPMGDKQASPTKLQVLQGAFTLLCLYTEFFAESAGLVPDCTRCQAFCFPQGVHFSRRPHMGPRYHLPKPGSRPRPSPLHGGRCAVLWARCLPRQRRSSPSPPRRGERGEEIAADGAASAAGLGMTKFGSATCRLFFLLWRI